MKTGDYEWCMDCDGEGVIEGRKCPACGGRGYVESADKKADIAAAKLLQQTIDEMERKKAQ